MEPQLDIRKALFKSSHPGVKLPTRTGTPASLRIQARSSGEGFTKSTLCSKPDCLDPHCPAQDLHNLSYIAEQLKYKPDSPVHQLKDISKGRTHRGSGNNARTSSDNEAPRSPRKKLVKKNPHAHTWTIVRPKQSVSKEKQDEKRMSGEYDNPYMIPI